LEFDVAARELAGAVAGLQRNLLDVSGESLADVALDLGLVHMAAGRPRQAAAALEKARYYGGPADLDPLEFQPETRRAYGAAAAKAVGEEPAVVLVRVHPAWAQVYLDGRAVGAGSTVLPGIAPGPHVLRAQAPDFTPVARQIVVQPGAVSLEVLWPLPRVASGVDGPEGRLAQEVHWGRFAGARWVLSVGRATGASRTITLTDAHVGVRILERTLERWDDEAIGALGRDVGRATAGDSAPATLFLD
jgi:hypothetical protein